MTTAVPPSATLRVHRLHPSAVVPTRGSALAAGYDLSASAPCAVPARGQALVQTGLALAVPDGTYGRVAPRSGLASKHGIHVGAGVVDADYRGEVRVLLLNMSDKEFEVAAGDRVAQLVLERIEMAPVVEVAHETCAASTSAAPAPPATPAASPEPRVVYHKSDNQELSVTERGAGGFGSTGGFAGVAVVAAAEPAPAPAE